MSHTRHEGSRVRTDGGTGGSARNWASLGVATYLVVGLGTTISFFLLAFLMSAMGPRTPAGGGGMGMSPFGMLSGGGIAGSLLLGLGLLMVLGAAIATGLGLFLGMQAGRGGSPAVAGAVSNGAGVLVTSIVMVVLLFIVGAAMGGGGTGGTGGTGSGLGVLIGAIVGLTVGVAATGAAAAAVGNTFSG